jgi:L-fucose isomerase-like protein
MFLPTVAFFSPIAGESLVNRILDRLDGVDFVVRSEKDLDAVDSIEKSRAILFVGTGGTEQLVASFIDRVTLESTILLAHTGNNSLPAAMEVRAYLEQHGVDSEIRQVSLDDFGDTVQVFIHYEEVLKDLQDKRIGVIGTPSPWLIASQVNRKAVERKWGIEIVDIPFSKLKTVEPVGEDSLDTLEIMPNSTKVKDSELRSAYEIAYSLLALVKKENLDALTLECFRLVETTDVTGCLGLAALNSLGIPAGCEGDIPATFTMLLAKVLTGETSFMANVVEVDKSENTLTLAHCTVPFSLVEDFDFVTHYETDKSVGIRGQFAKSDVTLLKVSGSDLSNYWVSSGVIEANLSKKEACRTQIRIRLDSPVDYFLDHSLANHHILIPGLHTKEIRAFLGNVPKS